MPAEYDDVIDLEQQDIEEGIDIVHASGAVNIEEVTAERNVFIPDETTAIDADALKNGSLKTIPESDQTSIGPGKVQSDDEKWTFTSQEVKDMALYSGQKLLREYIDSLHRRINDPSVKSDPEQIASLKNDERSLKRIYKARHILDVQNLGRVERLKYNGPQSTEPISAGELQIMADTVFAIQKESGCFHGLPEDEDAFKEHVFSNLQYMNQHGMQGMLRKAMQQYQNPKQYARIVTEMRKNAADVNYSDRIVDEREAAKDLITSAGQIENTSEIKIREVPVFDESTGQFITTEELYTRLYRQSEKLDALEKTLRDIKPSKIDSIEKTVEKAARKNDMKAKSWIENKGRDIRVLVNLDPMKQLELKVAGKTPEQVADQVKKTRQEYQKRMDILEGKKPVQETKSTVQHRLTRTVKQGL